MRKASGRPYRAHLALLLGAVVAAGSCVGSRPADEAPSTPPEAPAAREVAPAAPCPSDAVLEDLHRAIWRLERARDPEGAAGLVEDARRHLADEPTGADWDAFTRALQEAIDRDDGSAFAIEELRARLHASPCLTPALHQRFHERLATVPPAPPL